MNKMSFRLGSFSFRLSNDGQSIVVFQDGRVIDSYLFIGDTDSDFRNECRDWIDSENFSVV